MKTINDVVINDTMREVVKITIEKGYSNEYATYPIEVQIYKQIHGEDADIPYSWEMPIEILNKAIEIRGQIRREYMEKNSD